MTFGNIIENVLLGPLKLVFEVIFQVANRFIGHPGLAIIVLSLIMNILVLPLYKRADAMQEEARDIEMKLKKGVEHIKKTFSGDERMMILQAYYRQNNYKPTDALNGSVSLLLEIPFFMAAYQFLSHLNVMNGVSFGPIADLSAPDGLLVIGGVAINVLPVLMTTVNVISSAIYLKGFPLKTKIQLYAMALFFLVFLYESPACLVFYWTLNNVFSLVKTIFYKLKNPGRVINVLISLVGIGLFCLGFTGAASTSRRQIFLLGAGVAMQLPLIWMLVKNKLPAPKVKAEPKPSKSLFILGSILLTILVGALIPSNFIAASPQEYVDYTYFHNPLWYIVSAGCLAAGTFLVWLRVFYWLANPKGKVLFERLVWVLCGVMLVNYMFFGTNLGVISSALKYDAGMSFTLKEQLINILVIAGVGGALYLVVWKWKKAAAMVALTVAIALAGMSALNIVTIKDSVDDVIAMQEAQGETMPSFELSTTGQNVIVIMLDRGLGLQVPYIFNEKPELKEQYAGFTYYANTVSFGSVTNFASPALFGGYEYTPVEMNKRDDELLVDKHNEAIKVMPVLFDQNDFDVTVMDPTYANYQWVPDLTIYNDYPDIDTYITKGLFSDPAIKQQTIDANYRNFFCFSVMKTMPLFVQKTIYNDGAYNQASSGVEAISYTLQTQTDLSNATGVEQDFMDPYNVLLNLANMTKITTENKNTYMSLTNDTPHEPIMLQAPDYTPQEVVDNTEYDAAHADKNVVDGRTMVMNNTNQVIHYHANMATFLRLGEWFDYLREQGVWDNTRIILVSDHGKELYQFWSLYPPEGEKDYKLDLEVYCPLLMVKDFGSTEFTTSTEFMTNADVPTLATAGLIENPTNPFTGNPINSDEKTAHPQYLIASDQWDVNGNNGYTFKPGRWIEIKDDIWERDNWVIYFGFTVLKEHALP